MYANGGPKSSSHLSCRDDNLRPDISEVAPLLVPLFNEELKPIKVETDFSRVMIRAAWTSLSKKHQWRPAKVYTGVPDLVPLSPPEIAKHTALPGHPQLLRIISFTCDSSLPAFKSSCTRQLKLPDCLVSCPDSCLDNSRDLDYSPVKFLPLFGVLSLLDYFPIRQVPRPSPLTRLLFSWVSFCLYLNSFFTPPVVEISVVLWTVRFSQSDFSLAFRPV